jgi:hypothetical protein
MQVFSWRACIFGMVQLVLLCDNGRFSWFQKFLPGALYLVIEIGSTLVPVLTEEFISNKQALDYLIYLCTCGLTLASVLLYAEAMESGLSIDPALIPIFLIFMLHMICKVLQEPPKFLVPVLNLFTPPLAMCTIGGSCSSFYISVMTSFFGAFGTSFVDFFMILKPLTHVLLFLTLLSVYSAKKSVFYPPFLFSCGCCLAIIIAQACESFIFIIFGNLMLTGGVIWNNKVIKNYERRSV